MSGLARIALFVTTGALAVALATLRAIREPADVRGAHARLVVVMAGHRDEVSSGRLRGS